MAHTICFPWPEDSEQFPGSLHVHVLGINEPYNDNFDRYWSAMDASDPDFPLQRAIGQDLRPTSPSSGFSASVSLAGTDDKSRIEELINCVTDMREDAKHYRDLKKQEIRNRDTPPDPSLMGTTRDP
ncbi:hypothetical protein TSTA_107730 [Talaromyces stipitatus ATCC 10500]|uniref:Uncharacterized protein n=1 Tax=Talaromyces stipitatus (strain ATCC 10500 / CBS 375.48 / QM 6759 / NRRL 1006) TaxID=441959 RepID=B8MU78_TALSN|nr:uncharacterized protein TSTA_107730 [Talaromyces stipitatus ATCC 10500]EED11582.1 hypothetical protein TSTA_107730 [Talaromyces stipitatus ATCC 10500]